MAGDLAGKAAIACWAPSTASCLRRGQTGGSRVGCGFWEAGACLARPCPAGGPARARLASCRPTCHPWRGCPRLWGKCGREGQGAASSRAPAWAECGAHPNVQSTWGHVAPGAPAQVPGGPQSVSPGWAQVGRGLSSIPPRPVQLARPVTAAATLGVGRGGRSLPRGDSSNSSTLCCNGTWFAEGQGVCF